MPQRLLATRQVSPVRVFLSGAQPRSIPDACSGVTSAEHKHLCMAQHRGSNPKPLSVPVAGNTPTSHHFDTKIAREDPSLNLCDFYLFEGGRDKTVMIMTVNPDAGLSTSDIFHHEGLYAFRFDLNGDAHEELAFKIRFEPAKHQDGDEHVHVQRFEVREMHGAEAVSGFAGKVLIDGETGASHSKDGVRIYAGLAPELFAGDAFALHGFMAAFYKERRYDGDVFRHRENFFARRNVTAIVLEVPTEMIGRGRVHAWATVSLFGHAPEKQVSRWGLPDRKSVV